MTKKSIAKLIVLGVIIDTLLFGPKLVRTLYARTHPPIGGLNVLTKKEYEMKLKKEPSDIKGMTRYDKYRMGLSPYDGTDSDEDGLLDKDEIETYHSNPAKASTSGDLYSDGYKVQHGMVLRKKYKFRNDLHFDGNECPEVTLTADDPLDFTASVTRLTCPPSVDGYPVYAGYSVSNYEGPVTFDVSSLLQEQHLQASHLSIVCVYGYTPQRPKGHVKDGKITFQCKSRSAYDLYIVKRSLLTTVKNTLYGSTISSDALKDGLIYGSPILSAFGAKVH